MSKPEPSLIRELDVRPMLRAGEFKARLMRILRLPTRASSAAESLAQFRAGSPPACVPYHRATGPSHAEAPSLRQHRIVQVTDSQDPATEMAPVHDDIVYPQALPFIAAHFACFAAIWTGVTWQAAAIGIVSLAALGP